SSATPSGSGSSSRRDFDPCTQGGEGTLAVATPLNRRPSAYSQGVTTSDSTTIAMQFAATASLNSPCWRAVSRSTRLISPACASSRATITEIAGETPTAQQAPPIATALIVAIATKPSSTTHHHCASAAG